MHSEVIFWKIKRTNGSFLKKRHIRAVFKTNNSLGKDTRNDKSNLDTYRKSGINYTVVPIPKCLSVRREDLSKQWNIEKLS